MWMITQVLLVLTILTETSCQEVIFDGPPRKKTPCVGSSKPPVYHVVFDILLESSDPNNEWFPFLRLEILREGAKDYEFVCPVHVIPKGCESFPVDLCSCIYNSKFRKVDVNVTIHQVDSRARLRIRWFDANGERLSRGDHLLPEIPVPTTPLLTLSVDGVSGNLYSRTCKFRESIRKAQVFKVCCNSTITPCYTRIEFDGHIQATNGTPCVTYTSQTAESNVIVALAYAFCSKIYYTVGGYCSYPKGLHPLPGPTTKAVITTTRAPPIVKVVTTVTSPPETITSQGTDYPETEIEDITPPPDDQTTEAPLPESNKQLWTLLLGTLIVSTLIGIACFTGYWFYGRKKVKADVKPPRPKIVSFTPSDNIVEEDPLSSVFTASSAESGTDV